MKNKTELKTLKEIQEDKLYAYELEQALKAEAVKHWEKHNKEKSKMKENEMATSYWVEVGKLSILEEVFNITEEDLKEKTKRKIKHTK